MTPPNASPQPILPGVPVAFPCWVFGGNTKTWSYFETPSDSWLFCGFTHYLVAPATEDPATFPKAETLPVNSDETSEHPGGADVVPTEAIIVRGLQVLANSPMSLSLHEWSLFSSSVLALVARNAELDRQNLKLHQSLARFTNNA